MQLVSIPQAPVHHDSGIAAPTLPRTGFVRQSLLLKCLPFSKSTLWRWVKAGLFPAPVRLSVGITAWRAEDVQRWIAEREGAAEGPAS
ncbi:phage transcriptional regulator AlpA [Alicycliphilus sp. B1]|nr:phage transcriptional regulator AlpA [Alicycliphilus sp. B1]